VIKIGQKVRVKTGVSLHFSGKSGVVTKIDKNSRLPIFVTFENIVPEIGFTEEELWEGD